MAKAFVVQDNGKDNLVSLMDLVKDVKVLATRDLPLFGDPSLVLNKVRTALKEYDPEKDYLVLKGDPLLIGAATAMIAMKFGRVRCLKWDRQNEKYLFIEMPLAAVTAAQPRCAVG